MTVIHSVTGLGGCALLILALLATVGRVHRGSPAIRAIVFVAVLALLFVPVSGLTITACIRALSGDFSTTSLVLLAIVCIGQFSARDLVSARHVTPLMVVVLCAGLLLYPFALGISMFDPYVGGYGSNLFYGALLLLTLAAWHAELYLIVICTTFGSAAFLLGISESCNLWDYLIDPPLTLFAIIWLAWRLIKNLRAMRQSATAPAE